MAFNLNTPSGQKRFPDGASWRMNNDGLLVIHTTDGKRLTYSASGWFSIEEEQPASTEPWVVVR